jgi:hypothetical protein
MGLLNMVAPEGWMCTCVCNTDYLDGATVPGDDAPVGYRDPGFNMRTTMHSANTLLMQRHVKMTACIIQQRLLHDDGGVIYLTSPVVIYPYDTPAKEMVPRDGRTEVIMRFTQEDQLEVVVLVVGPIAKTYDTLKRGILSPSGTAARWCATIRAHPLDDDLYEPDTVLVED